MVRLLPSPAPARTLALLSALVAAACVSPVRRGELAAEAGDAVGALAAWERGALAGDAAAQFLVGLCHEEGRGTPVDCGAAAAWYEAAARQGHAAAQNNLGLLCFRGRGVGRDVDAAALWFARAADQGFAPAMCNRGMLFLLGQGEPHDPAAAREWFDRAATLGDGKAQRMVAAMERTAARAGGTNGPAGPEEARPLADRLAARLCAEAQVAAPAR